jgi:hypothetical protein
MRNIILVYYVHQSSLDTKHYRECNPSFYILLTEEKAEMQHWWNYIGCLNR